MKDFKNIIKYDDLGLQQDNEVSNKYVETKLSNTVIMLGTDQLLKKFPHYCTISVRKAYPNNNGFSFDLLYLAKGAMW